jgi:hypothetical protein
MSQKAGSASYQIFSAGFSLALFAAFRVLSDFRGWRTVLFDDLGSNALAEPERPLPAALGSPPLGSEMNFAAPEAGLLWRRSENVNIPSISLSAPRNQLGSRRAPSGNSLYAGCFHESIFK